MLLLVIVFLSSMAHEVAAGTDALAASCPGFPMSVADEGALNTAIGCYNAKTTAGTYLITLTADIVLEASTIPIDNPTAGVELVIDGAGFKVNGQAFFLYMRPFRITTDTTVIMNNLSITRVWSAYGGGGISNEGGTLTINNSTLSGNIGDYAGAISNEGGTLTINNSTLSGNWGGTAGAIYNEGGTLTISNSTLSGNVAPQGAISNEGGTLMISNSTLNMNTGENVGGIYNKGGTLMISNSTLYGNAVGGWDMSGAGGIHSRSGRVTITNSTISGNQTQNYAIPGGMLFEEGVVMLANSLISNNDPYDCVGGPIVASHTLIENDGCGLVDGVNGNIIGKDPLLGPLQDNGGPTRTRELWPGSPAINAGDNTLAVDAAGNPLATDQRGAGFARIWGEVVDMGAFEVGVSEPKPCPPGPFTVSSEAELNDAIRCYNALNGPDTVQISLAADIDLTQSLMTISNPTAGLDLVIEGAGFKVDGQGIRDVRPLTIAANTTVTMNNLTITRGAGSFGGRGGGIHNRGTLMISNSTLSNNGGWVGGIQNRGTLTISNSTLSGNGGGLAGAISNEGGMLMISNSTLSRNHSYTVGGIYNKDGTLVISNSTLYGNWNDGAYYGPNVGGIHSQGGTVTITSSTISGNRGGPINDGPPPFGGMLFEGGVVIVANSVISNNTQFFGIGNTDDDCAGGPIVASHTLIQNDGCGLVDGANGNIIGVDPLLGPLQDNGGPTLTRALLAGSPAINAGDNTLAVDAAGNPLATDQRGAGFPRIPGNLIRNYCFEDGPSPWQFFSDGQGSYAVSSLDPYQGQFAAKVAIQQPGSNVQLYQKDLALKPNTPYELLFAASSSNGNDLSVYLQKHDAPYTNYGLNNYRVNLNPGWGVYTTTFTTAGFSSPVTDGRLRFWLAPYDTAGMSYHIDWVILREVDAANPPIPPDPPVYVPPPGYCADHPGNLVKNGGFEDDKTSWLFNTDGVGSFKVATANPYECAKNALVAISQPGDNVQLYQKNIVLQPNQTYQLRLAARSSGGQDVALFLHQHGAPYTNYGLNGVVLDLTSEWQVFVVEFNAKITAPVTDGRLRLWLAPYDQAGASFEFDDVVLLPKSQTTALETSGETVSSTLAQGRANERVSSAQVPVRSVLRQGYYLDGDDAGRLAGGYVAASGPAMCYAARPSLATLWPADGKRVKVRLTNLGHPQSVAVSGISQDEPTGSEPDAKILAGPVVELRRERDADGDGRVYHITFVAQYASGECRHEVVVSVPITKRGVANDSGGRFDSTQATRPE